RASTLAHSFDTDPSDGLSWWTADDSGMETDQPNHAGPVLSPAQYSSCPSLPYVNGSSGPLNCSATPYCEGSLIPTGGISIGNVNYLFFFSAHWWSQTEGGVWQVNHSGIARDNGSKGQTWTLPSAANQ